MTSTHATTMKDYFISYNKADRKWAAWISWELENNGYEVAFQDWDFRPGNTFPYLMDNAMKEFKQQSPRSFS